MKAYNLLKELYYSIKINKFKSFNRNLKYIDESTQFINKSTFSSSNRYLIWVDTKNFKTNIFKGSKNKWTLINSYLCTIGKPWAPTIKGTFYVGAKGFSFGEARGFRCLYYTQIKDNYLFHSIVYYLDGTIKDDRLGMQLTDGCVRLATKNAKWIYDNIPTGTTIFIN